MNQDGTDLSSYPELNGNFEGTPSITEGVSRLFADTGNGNFHVHLTLTTRRGADPDDVWVFLGRRMLAAAIPYFKGACEVSGNVHIGQYIPRGADHPCPERLAVTLLAPSLILTGLKISEVDCPTLHIAGDSTAAELTAAYPYHPMVSSAGWGQMLSCFLSGKMAIDNQAHQGLGTETFRRDGHYDVLLRELKPQDYVLISFGQKDRKSKDLAPTTGYRDNLSRYADEILEAGAFPILVTPLAENTWYAGGYNDQLKAHAEIIESIGEKYRIPVLDLHGKTSSAIRAMGQEEASVLFRSDDPMQVNDCGAYFAARIVASEIRRACGWTEGYQMLAEAIDKHTLTETDPARQLFTSYRSRGSKTVE